MAMKMKSFLIMILFFVFAGLPAFADTSIKAEVNKTSISTDNTLTYKLELTTTERNLPNLKLPKFEGFQVISQAQSSNVSFEKDEMKSQAVFEFILAPAEAGKFKIEPSVVQTKGKAYSTDSFEIDVTQGKPRPPSLKEKPPPESEEPQYSL
jgi:hypothetical protein